LRFSLSYRDVESARRAGVHADTSRCGEGSAVCAELTAVITPPAESPHGQMGAGRTYVRVEGKVALPSRGWIQRATLGFLLSASGAARLSALSKALGERIIPHRVINTDGHAAYPYRRAQLKGEGDLNRGLSHRRAIFEKTLLEQEPQRHQGGSTTVSIFDHFLPPAHARRATAIYDPQRPSLWK